VAVTNDQQTIFSGGTDRTIKAWSVARKEVFEIGEGHTGWVNSLALSPDNSYLISGSGDRTVRIWRTGNMQQICVLKGHTREVWSGR
jgi:WD40 repeat protein